MTDEYICTLVSHGNGVYEYEPTGQEIVRCKDCKHFHKAEPTKGDISNVTYCLIEDDGLIISFPGDDDFCSRGERKDEADNG